ncbi:MAG: glycosyltransferase family 1 protein [Caldimonas sp.]
MHITYVTETFPPELNGVALTVARTVQHLRDRGHAVDLIRPRQPSDPAAAKAAEWLTSGTQIPMYPDLRFGFARASGLRARYESNPPDLVHLATPGPLAWQALRVARSLGIPVTSDFRTNFHQYSRHYHLGALANFTLWGLRHFHNRCERTFVPTRAAERELAAAGFERLVVIGRGVDTRRFSPERRSDALRAAWGAAADAPVLLYVGRVAAEKNIAVALRAFEALRAQCAEARMVVVGDGPLRAELEAAHPAVRFVGVKRGDDLAAHYASADLFVFPSLTETFGNVTLEALASGLPVVAFDVAAAAEHVTTGVNGVVVAASDEAGLVAAAVSLALKPRRLEAMRPCAVASACKARWDDVLGRFEAELKDTIDVVKAPPQADAVVA